MTAEPICRGHTTVCIIRPARTYQILGRTSTAAALCDPCVGRLRAMGMAIEARPEWRRRADAGALPAKDFSGAGR